LVVDRRHWRPFLCGAEETAPGGCVPIGRAHMRATAPTSQFLGRSRRGRRRQHFVHTFTHSLCVVNRLSCHSLHTLDMRENPKVSSALRSTQERA
jgi:hypothetical protein